MQYSKNSIRVSSLAIAVISSVFFLILGYYGRPLLDDYGFIGLTDKLGLFGFIKFQYVTWQGRFSGAFITGILNILFGHQKTLLLSTLCCMCLGYCSIFPIIKKFFKGTIGCTILISVILINIGVLTMCNLSTLYWICTTGYLYSIWFTFLLIYALFFCKNNKVRIPLALVNAFLLMGYSEAYTLLLAGLLALTTIWLVIDKKYNIAEIWLNIVCIFFLCVGFVFIIKAPGNSARMADVHSYYSDISTFELLPYVGTSIKAAIILSARILSSSLLILLSIPLFAGLGSSFTNLSELHHPPLIKLTILASAFLIIMVFAYTAGCVFGLGWYAPLRSSSFIHLFIAALTGILSIFFGMEYHKKTLHYLGTICGLLICCIIISRYHNEIRSVKDYSAKIDNCMAKISEAIDSQKEYVIVEEFHFVPRQNAYSKVRNIFNYCIGSKKRIYEPYFPYESYALSTDPNNWKNKGVASYFGSDIKIIGWTPAE